MRHATYYGNHMESPVPAANWDRMGIGKDGSMNEDVRLRILMQKILPGHKRQPKAVERPHVRRCLRANKRVGNKLCES